MRTCMTACVELRVGATIEYDCPFGSSEDYKSDRFFKKYRGKRATITGFPMEYVGPLDREGRMPGTYYRAGGVYAQFEGEEEIHALKVIHCLLVSQTTTLAHTDHLQSQRAGDLPYPVLFYPGDVVAKNDDLLGAERVVESVEMQGGGTALYVLAESEDARRAREKEAEERKKRATAEGRWHAGVTCSIPRTERCGAEALRLLREGNVRRLYEGRQLHFDSPEDELRFWAQEGLSRPVYPGDGFWFFNDLSTVQNMLENGAGDLALREERNTVEVFDKHPERRYIVRRIHDCFDARRGRVRTVALEFQDPPDAEAEVDEAGAGPPVVTLVG